MTAAATDEKPVLRRLLELYAHDFSELDGSDVGDDGAYGYPHLDAYWAESERHPFLIRVDGHLAGFALVRSGRPHDMAEFFVMRKYRRGGVGAEAARAVFAQFPGEWQVRQIAANVAATAFWRTVIPVPFTEDTNDEGPVQHFVIAANEDEPVALPEVVRRYQDAHDRHDTAGAVAMFARDARVVDDGHEYRGAEEITGWLNKTASEFTFTRTLLSAEPLARDTWLVVNHLEGNFPGGVVDLRYQFVLVDDLISELVIAP